MRVRFLPGDYVIYRKQKFSAHPGPGAKNIYPTPNGDTYSYAVDKFWIVVAVQPNGRIMVRTRRGKQFELNADDPALRRAHWLLRLWFWDRFPALKDDVDTRLSRLVSKIPAAEGRVIAKL
jgi:hypothetical protein